MAFQKGHVKTGGRKKGQLNRGTEEVRKLAQKFGKDAVEKLYSLMNNAEDERAQVAAAKELLDRAYGKSTQLMGGDSSAAPMKVVIMGDDAKL